MSLRGWFSRSLNISMPKQGPGIVGVPTTMQQATTSIMFLDQDGNLMESVMNDDFSSYPKKGK